MAIDPASRNSNPFASHDPATPADKTPADLVPVAWQRDDMTYGGWLDAHPHNHKQFIERGHKIRALTPLDEAAERIAAERDLADTANKQNALLWKHNAALETQLADLMGDDEDKPRYTTKRLRQEIERAREQDAERIAALEADNERLRHVYAQQSELSAQYLIRAETAERREAEFRAAGTAAFNSLQHYAEQNENVLHSLALLDAALAQKEGER